MEWVEDGKEDSCNDMETESVYIKNPSNKPDNLHPPTHSLTKTHGKALKLNEYKESSPENYQVKNFIICVNGPYKYKEKVFLNVFFFFLMMYKEGVTYV